MGVGPHGREVTLFRTSSDNQETISDEVIDPVLRSTDTNTQPSSTLTSTLIQHTPADGDENNPPATPAIPATQTPKQGPKPSTFGNSKLDAAVARSNVKPVSKKRSWEDTFTSIQKYNILLQISVHN